MARTLGPVKKRRVVRRGRAIGPAGPIEEVEEEQLQSEGAIPELTQVKSRWKGNNYGGPALPCRICRHWDIHVIDAKNDDDEDIKVCVVMRDSGEKREVDTGSKSCRYCQLETYFHCRDVSMMMNPVACAYRYFNDLHLDCSECRTGETMVDYIHTFLGEDVPTEEEIKERLARRGTHDPYADAFETEEEA